MLSRLTYRPEFLLVFTFTGLILVGGTLLSLPVCQAEPGRVGVLDAFFTATSAVCVTGLITKDTPVDFSRVGQTVILVLIQLGGLGVMTFGALIAQVLGRRLSFGSTAALRDVLFQRDVQQGFRSAVVHVVGLVLVVELLGAVLLYLALRQMPAGTGGWYEAVFLSISAFCNAGFSVYSDNLIGVRGSTLLVGTIMGLIILGGLGYMVVLEVAGRLSARLVGRRPRSVVWSLNTRIVLTASAVLIFGGALALILLGLTADEETWGETIWHALFQSVTARTAGFNSVDVSLLPVPSLLILIGLMYVGGSPGSCAGGVKTTSVAVWAARVVNQLLRNDRVHLGGRRIEDDILRRASLVMGLATGWITVGVMILAITEDVGNTARFEELIFEQVSAFGTVGLSTGLTPKLSTAGKLWIMASMFVGRLGPLTVALAVVTQRRRVPVDYPREPVMIG